MYSLVMKRNCSVNFLIGRQQIFVPNASAGQIVAHGTLDFCNRMHEQYCANGYDTEVIGGADDCVIVLGSKTPETIDAMLRQI